MPDESGPFQHLLKHTKQHLHHLQEKVGHFKKNHAHELEESVENSDANDIPVQKVLVEVSPSSIARATIVIILLFLLFYFLYQISAILVLFFVSFLLAAALDPVIGFLQRHKIPRSIGVLFIYLVIFLILGELISNLAPLIAKQVYDIARSINDFALNMTSGNSNHLPFARELKPYFDQIYQAVDLKAASTQIQTALQLIAAQLLNISVGLMNVVLVLVLTFFMTVEEKSLEQFYLSLFPSKYAHYISTRLGAIKEKIGYWLRGQLLLSLVASVLSYIGLIILGVDYALTLSLIAGIMMVIPIIGRIFALILTIPIVMNQSPLLSLWVGIYYLILQQIEVNILIPYIMNKAVGLSPIIITFAMLVGSQYLGVLGLVISIPIATTVALFVRDYTEKAK